MDDQRVTEVINKTLHTKPTDGSTHWSTRGLASVTGISKSTVARYLQLKPHRVESFKLSTAPLFLEKLRDVVGLYLNPPENALVLCVDQKSQCQRWNARSRCCRWGWAMSKASRMTMCAMEPRRCLPR